MFNRETYKTPVIFAYLQSTEKSAKVPLLKRPNCFITQIPNLSMATYPINEWSRFKHIIQSWRIAIISKKSKNIPIFEYEKFMTILLWQKIYQYSNKRNLWQIYWDTFLGQKQNIFILPKFMWNNDKNTLNSGSAKSSDEGLHSWKVINCRTFGLPQPKIWNYRNWKGI